MSSVHPLARRRRRPSSATSVRKGSGERLLLLHPFTMSHHIWRGMIDDLATDHDVMAVTMPGHLGTDRVRLTQLSPTHLADAVEAQLDEAGWDTCHLAGNSLGGWVALELARRGRADSVTAFAPAGGWDPWTLDMAILGAKFVAIAPALGFAAVAGGLLGRVQPAVRLAYRLLAETPLDPVDAESCLKAATGCHGYAGVLLAGLKGAVMNGVEDVSAPVLLVICEKDRVIGSTRYFTRYLDKLPDVEVVTLEGMGHVPMVQDPQLCSRLVREHVQAHLRPAAMEA